MGTQSTQWIADAVNEYVGRAIDNNTPKAFLGSWLAAESVDANLSQVQVSNKTWRYIPKLSSVTGLVAGSQVLIIKYPGLPAVIHGVLVGNVTLAV